MRTTHVPLDGPNTDALLRAVALTPPRPQPAPPLGRAALAAAPLLLPQLAAADPLRPRGGGRLRLALAPVGSTTELWAQVGAGAWGGGRVCVGGWGVEPFMWRTE